MGGEDDFTGAPSFVVYMLSGKKEVDDGTVSGDWTEVVIGDQNDANAPPQTGDDSFTDWSVSQVSPLLFSGG